jgi:hypothetical protein
MRDHLEALPVDPLFTRMVEMELLQLVLPVADGDETAWRVVDLNGVAVVDDVKGRAPLGELDRRQVRRLRVADVDRRLTMAEPAGLKGLIEL